MDGKHEVVYILKSKDLGDCRIKQYVDQKQLASLLGRDDVVMVSVDNPQTVTYRKKGSGSRKRYR
jgi:hypothetical protein